jgi:hypothetical protein
MKILTKQQLCCSGFMVSELGQTRISLFLEHGAYHLKSINVLGSGLVWEVLASYSEAINKFKALRRIQRGNYDLSQYEIAK